MFKATGTLVYSPNWWLVVNVDGDIGKYYRSLVKFYIPSLKLNPPKFKSHITVIAGKYEQPKNKNLWNKYNRNLIEFEYDSEIAIDREYFWLAVKCEMLEDIREELELPRTIKHPWHLTIGNTIDTI